MRDKDQILAARDFKLLVKKVDQLTRDVMMLTERLDRLQQEVAPDLSTREDRPAAEEE